MSEDKEWSLKGKEKMIHESNIGFDDAVKGYEECYLIEDIDTLREKLIEDFKFAIEKEYQYLLPQIEKIINKRFGVI